MPGGRPVAIYALCDPDTLEPRYIGKTVNPVTRLTQHVSPSSLSGRTHKSHWISKLQRRGKRPLMVILEWVSEASWSMMEKRYISELRLIGARLTNGDEGGLGGQTGPEKRSRYLKRMLSKAYSDFIRDGQIELANKHAQRLRRLYQAHPKFMPAGWATAGI